VKNVTINIPTYFATLSEILAQTPKEVVQGYLFLRAISQLYSYIDAPETKPLRDFIETFTGPSNKSRWRTCLSRVNEGVWFPGGYSSLTGIVGRFFIEKTYDEESREYTHEILSTIREEFVSRLAEKDWLDEPTKKAAADKANKMLQLVGYTEVSIYPHTFLLVSKICNFNPRYTEP
jgi:endothelin-converting enzyme